MQSDVTITAQNLVKTFRTRRGIVQAVAGVTLEVRRGETFGLIGPDGSGKTTTTRVILGLLRRTSGESAILGFDSMRDTYAIRERVGYIAQKFALPADLTVLESMRFFADIHGVSLAEQKRRIPELLEFAGLTAFTGRLGGRLSGGMKKKLALACSLVHEPQVVMLDEPTLGVDPVSRREFWNLLGRLRAEQGLTIFVCTPYMDEAERCDWVGLLYEGQIIARNTPATIKRMVPGRLLQFAPQPFPLAQRLVTGMEGVLEVQTYGAQLHVFVDDVALRLPQLETALQAAGVHYEGCREIEPRMEEAFISLIRRRRDAVAATTLAQEGVER
ncbi:MAG: ABC transporter ATP-binding protein [Anaerolineae bacterium]|jgi:ABC-2 type transport system ATP-binding protein|nr:ABC transporter ATP-binding protein [Anaerolineae bacterium]